MKICPQCGTQYSDHTLRFCLQDGTPLNAGSEAEPPTVVMDETATFVPGRGERINVPIQVSPDRETETLVRPAIGEKKRSNTPLAVTLTVLVMLVLFGFAGGAAWLYFRDRGEVPAGNISNVGPRMSSNGNAGPRQENSSGSANNGIVASPTPPPTSNSSPEPAESPNVVPVDMPAAKKDVAQRISGWISRLESRDLTGYMSNYADRVDYFTKPNSSVSSVRADKARAFARYTSMRVNLSDLNVDVAASGDAATATFDKEWNFAGRGSASSGKVRSQLKLRNIDGRWLIVSERDLKVYYTR